MNPLLLAYLVLWLLRSGGQALLVVLNLSHLRRYSASVPEGFDGTVTPEQLKRISDYTSVSDRSGLVSRLAEQTFFLFLLVTGFLPFLNRVIEQGTPGFVLRGLLFFGILGGLEELFQVPFSLYDTFVIEARFGFNRRSFRMWLLDWVKNLGVVAVLGGILLACLLLLVSALGHAWWFWAWLAVGLFEVLMLWFFPVVIAPLFNKFKPLENRTLEERIESLMKRAGLQIKGVLKMDAGKRSRHTNAYFTGIGKSKRIVLFDTLLDVHEEDEILAILAHEIGHWKKCHVLKQILLAEIVSLAAFWLAAQWINWPFLYRAFGFQEPVAYVGLFLAGALLGPMGFFLQPAGSALSRRFEVEADDYGAALMRATEPMERALRRLALDNLSNLSPHPLYAWYYFGHPPMVERIARMKEWGRHLQNR